MGFLWLHHIRTLSDLASNVHETPLPKRDVRPPGEHRERLHPLALGERALHSAQLSAAHTERPAWKTYHRHLHCLQGVSLIRPSTQVSGTRQVAERGRFSSSALGRRASATTFSMWRWLRPSRVQQIGHLPLHSGPRSFCPEGRTPDSLF